ncbi:MAG: helix-turn-helix domain-containing protein [Methanomassiliicoccales archaeon]
MSEINVSLEKEIEQIKKAILDIQEILKTVLENKHHLDSFSIPIRNRSDLLEVMVSQVMDDVEEGLSQNMVKRCDMKEPCRATFKNFLQKNAALLEKDVVREEIIITNRDELDRLRDTAPYSKCERCFEEVNRLFSKQVRLMRSLRIFTTTADKKQEIHELKEETFVSEVLEPLASMHRLQILKAVSTGPRTFSGLKDATGLRGGNLLFHIQKLIDATMIVQRHNRGDYMITEKGFKILKGMSDVNQLIKS